MAPDLSIAGRRQEPWPDRRNNDHAGVERMCWRPPVSHAPCSTLLHAAARVASVNAPLLGYGYGQPMPACRPYCLIRNDAISLVASSLPAPAMPALRQTLPTIHNTPWPEIGPPPSLSLIHRPSTRPSHPDPVILFCSPPTRQPGPRWLDTPHCLLVCLLA
ncbi:hypothetical protein COCSADRAFT_348370 [Bipolaris sorokiniana ND90Pr]|uniref:Uncharacterized protein n=1 Tax=Cochliobolus sativus (strain ND90Pr / ATCC 201652) TaxID=665912 RepID=M2QUX6_COCSN|nr:uncharacterized protein COCSADRAFT_348370 [Bipolaris sorokiniana ND90Pr]EMD58939.1 hypothetical protein COCSADRAFT_348370 [Bipolaris sorokiniana ND90Pr]